MQYHNNLFNIHFNVVPYHNEVDVREIYEVLNDVLILETKYQYLTN